MRASRAALLICGGALVIATARPAAAEDDAWFARDKALHFSATTAIAAGGYGASTWIFEDRRARFATGAGLALTAGVGKELFDWTGSGDPSWRDLTWDLAGALTGAAVAYVVDRYLLPWLSEP